MLMIMTAMINDEDNDDDYYNNVFVWMHFQSRVNWTSNKSDVRFDLNDSYGDNLSLSSRT